VTRTYIFYTCTHAWWCGERTCLVQFLKDEKPNKKKRKKKKRNSVLSHPRGSPLKNSHHTRISSVSSCIVFALPFAGRHTRPHILLDYTTKSSDEFCMIIYIYIYTVYARHPHTRATPQRPRPAYENSIYL